MRAVDPGLSWLAIAGGRVIGATAADGSRAMRTAIAEFIACHDVTDLVKAPDEAVRRFFRKPWPGREAALALLAQQESTPDAT